MTWRMGYMFIMMLIGLSLKTIIVLVRWAVEEAKQPLSVEKNLGIQPVPSENKDRSSVLFFIPSKLKAKLT